MDQEEDAMKIRREGMNECLFITVPSVRRRRGFTFLEIMMVVVIIGILASLVIQQFAGKTRRAKIIMARNDLKSIETALASFEMEAGEFPTTEQGLGALVERPGEIPEDAWSQHLKEIPVDPWSLAYDYKCPGDHGDFDLASRGPDKKPETGDDIANWVKPD